MTKQEGPGGSTVLWSGVTSWQVLGHKSLCQALEPQVLYFLGALHILGIKISAFARVSLFDSPE